MADTGIDFLAARRRAHDVGWTKTASELGVGLDWLRRRADPRYAYFRNPGVIHPRQDRRDNAGALASAARLMAQIPPDTRTPMERLMGLPPHGRSALDQHRVEEAVERAPVAPRLPYVRFLDPKEQKVKL